MYTGISGCRKAVNIGLKLAEKESLGLASSPGHSQILSSSQFSPRLRDKIWEWPGDEANQAVFPRNISRLKTAFITRNGAPTTGKEDVFE